METDDSYQIILDPAAEDKQQAVALFLSGCFSLPPASTKRIAASGPIAILSNLDGVQAETILAELSSSIPEGGSLRIVQEEDAADVSRLEWPRPPQIFGRPLSDFSLIIEETEAPCPSCGKMLKVKTEKDGRLVIKLVHPAGNTVMIPNPNSEEGDKDPLFSGFKPLATDSCTFASMRQLQAGDTGFWSGSRSAMLPSSYETPSEPVKEQKKTAETATSARSAGGLAAYMKPGVFAVVLARTKDPQVVKKVGEVMGISEDEARQRCLSPSLAVARDISLDEAQTLLARLKMLGGRARIVKPM